MELPVRDKVQSKEDFVLDEQELTLAGLVCDNFIRRYFVPTVASKLVALPLPEKMNMFRWESYLVARCWITGEIPLSATLKLKLAGKPWEKRDRRTKISQ